MKEAKASDGSRPLKTEEVSDFQIEGQDFGGGVGTGRNGVEVWREDLDVRKCDNEPDANSNLDRSGAGLMPRVGARSVVPADIPQLQVPLLIQQVQ